MTPSPNELEVLREELARVSAITAAAGQQLEHFGEDGVGMALKVIAEVRHQLDLAERELVRIARRSGRSWTQISSELNIIEPKQTEEQADATG